MKQLFFFTCLLTVYLPANAADTLTVLFTHDLHSYFTGSREIDGNDSIVHTGGYARLYTAIERIRQKNPDATLLVDAGDVAMGTFFHTLFTTHFAELQLMDDMGYEATTIGNHDFDFGVDALQEAIHVYLSGNRPRSCSLIASNIGGLSGVEEYKIITKAGYRIGIFGLLGTEAREQSLIDKNLPCENYLKAAKRMVKLLRETEKVDLVLCLSHSGTNKNPKYSEDEQLARDVPGIDLIISGHSHSLLTKPLMAGNTLIVSAGAYGKYLGCVQLVMTGKKFRCASYELIKMDSAVAAHSLMDTKIEHYKRLVEKHYLNVEKTGFDDPLVKATNSVLVFSDSFPLGDLIADAFVEAVRRVDNRRPDIAIVPEGSIRENLYKGLVTTGEVFNILSLGIRADKKPAFPLLKVYLYGHELRDLCEVDASISKIVSGAQLFYSGIRYTYYPGSLFCNKVKKIEILDTAGRYTVPRKDSLYSVVASLYAAKMMGIVKEKTYGILSLTPKNASGEPVTDWNEVIVHDSSGAEIKEWVALKNYLQPAGKKDEITEFDYKEQWQKRKIKQNGFSLTTEIMYTSIFALCIYVIIIVISATIVLLVFKLIKKIIIYTRKH